MNSIARKFGRTKREESAASSIGFSPDMQDSQVHVIPAPGSSPALSEPDSGVFAAAKALAGKSHTGKANGPRDVEPTQGWVTLVVYGWENVQPGTLSWIFPSLAAAVGAVRALKNAVKWAILVGQRRAAPVDVEAERASGHVLLEAS